MTIQDGYARVTPFEVAFPITDRADRWMARIRERAREDGMEAALEDPGLFLSLPAVAEVVNEMREPGAGTGAVQKHGILLYHAFHFQEAERPLYLLRTAAARYLVETEDFGTAAEDRDEDGGVELPARAGYLQLPRQLFWMVPTEEGPPEPVDGLFWATPDGGRLSLLVVGGMREGRPGFSVVPLPPVPLGDAESWLRARVREGGPDFETTLPGGELDRLYSFEATGEILKLVARAFRYVSDHPRAVSAAERRSRAPTEEETATGDRTGVADEAARGGSGDAGVREGPRPTALPYRSIHLRDQPEAGEEGPNEVDVDTGSDGTLDGT